MNTTSEKVRAYGDRLGVLLRQCIEDFPSRPDAFLWNCRRCLECIAYAGYTSKNEGFQPGSNEGEVANYAKVLPKELRDEWNFVLGKSNYGVHTQGTFPIEYEKAARPCTEHLCRIATWFYEQSGSWSGGLPAGVRDDLATLRSGHWPVPRNYEAELQARTHAFNRESAQLTARIAELEQQQKVEARIWLEEGARLRQQSHDHQATRDRALELERSLQDAHAERVRVETNLYTAESKLRELKARLEEQEQLRRAALEWTPTPAPSVLSQTQFEHTSSPSRRWWWMVPAMAVLVMAASWVTSRESARAELASAPVASQVVSAVIPPSMVLASEPAAPPTPAPVAVSPPLSCPPTMSLVTERMVNLPQPHRRLWPSGPEVLAPSKVASFCIDKDLVATTDYQACADQGQCVRPDRPTNDACSWTWTKKRPLLCMTHDEADGFCRQMRGGRLPTVLEREAAQHLTPPLAVHNRTGEWAADLFPAAAFGRGPVLTPCKKGSPCAMIFAPLVSSVPSGAPDAAALDGGWNRDVVTERRPDLGFRCVKDRLADPPWRVGGADPAWERTPKLPRHMHPHAGTTTFSLVCDAMPIASILVPGVNESVRATSSSRRSPDLLRRQNTNGASEMGGPPSRSK